jgi:hypothetical protein
MSNLTGPLSHLEGPSLSLNIRALGLPGQAAEVRVVKSSHLVLQINVLIKRAVSPAGPVELSLEGRVSLEVTLPEGFGNFINKLNLLDKTLNVAADYKYDDNDRHMKQNKKNQDLFRKTLSSIKDYMKGTLDLEENHVIRATVIRALENNECSSIAKTIQKY